MNDAVIVINIEREAEAIKETADNTIPFFMPECIHELTNRLIDIKILAIKNVVTVPATLKKIDDAEESLRNLFEHYKVNFGVIPKAKVM